MSETQWCRVYWGSHGCDLPRGHRGHHLCDCCECENHPDPDEGCVGAWPYYGFVRTTFYGEDVPLRRRLTDKLRWRIIQAQDRRSFSQRG